MPKLKTRKSVKKRLKITASGKLVGRHPGRKHLLSTKSSKRKRRLRQPLVLTHRIQKNIVPTIPNLNVLK